MAEIALVASIVQIAEIGCRLSSRLYTFGETVASADRSILAISKDISLTSSVLKELGKTFQNDQGRIYSSNATKTAEGVVEECSNTFQEIDNMLLKKAPHIISQSLDRSSRAKTMLERLRWPTIKGKIDVLNSNLDRLKSTLNLMLNVIIYAQQVAHRTEPLSVMAEQRQLIEVLAQIKDERDRALYQARQALGQGSPMLSEEHSSAMAQDLLANSCVAHPAIIGSNKQPQTNGDTISISSQASTLTAGTEKKSHIERLLNEYTRLQRNIVQEVHSEQYNIEKESRVRLQQRIDLAHESEIRHLHHINSGQNGSIERVDVLKLSRSEPSERPEKNPDTLHTGIKKCMKEAPPYLGDGAKRQQQLPSPKNADSEEHKRTDAFWTPQVTPDGILFYYNTITRRSVIELPDRAKEDASGCTVNRMIDVNIPVWPPPEVEARYTERDEEKYDETAASEVTPLSNTPLAQEKGIQDQAKSHVSEHPPVQLNVMRPSFKLGDEKRKRNATSSQRFRQRRKEKEEEQRRVEKELRPRVAQLENKLRERSDYEEEDEATVVKSETSEKVKDSTASRKPMDYSPETDMQRDRMNAMDSFVKGERMREAQWSYLERDSTENVSTAHFFADQSQGVQELQELDADNDQEMNMPFIGYSYKHFVPASPPTEASQAPEEMWDAPDSWVAKETSQEGQKPPVDDHLSLQFSREIETTPKAMPSQVEEEEQNLGARWEDIAAKENEQPLPYPRSELARQNEKNDGDSDGDGDGTEISIVDTLLAQWTTVKPIAGFAR